MTTRELAQRFPGDQAFRLKVVWCDCCDAGSAQPAVAGIDDREGHTIHLCLRCLREYAIECGMAPAQVSPCEVNP